MSWEHSGNIGGRAYLKKVGHWQWSLEASYSWLLPFSHSASWRTMVLSFPSIKDAKSWDDPSETRSWITYFFCRADILVSAMGRLQNEWIYMAHPSVPEAVFACPGSSVVSLFWVNSYAQLVEEGQTVGDGHRMRDAPRKFYILVQFTNSRACLLSSFSFLFNVNPHLFSLLNVCFLLGKSHSFLLCVVFPL